MGMSQGPQSKKNLNVELNLLPVFDVLSVCICFLLMTVVWVEIRAMETKQAIGGQSKAETDKTASVWLTIDEANNVVVVLKPTSGAESRMVIAGRGGVIDYARAKLVLASAFSRNVRATHILPAKTTKYDQVIKLMDIAKQVGIQNIGLSPI
ncbi:MAG: biopolymer transporter ExbD [Bdellovibrionaceae bacterium]|nr:biopolymer transporter ExbD [Bdellovibrio sp.]